MHRPTSFSEAVAVLPMSAVSPLEAHENPPGPALNHACHVKLPKNIAFRVADCSTFMCPLLESFRLPGCRGVQVAI